MMFFADETMNLVCYSLLFVDRFWLEIPLIPADMFMHGSVRSCRWGYFRLLLSNLKCIRKRASTSMHQQQQSRILFDGDDGDNNDDDDDAGVVSFAIAWSPALRWGDAGGWVIWRWWGGCGRCRDRGDIAYASGAPSDVSGDGFVGRAAIVAAAVVAG